MTAKTKINQALSALEDGDQLLSGGKAKAKDRGEKKTNAKKSTKVKKKPKELPNPRGGLKDEPKQETKRPKQAKGKPKNKSDAPKGTKKPKTEKLKKGRLKKGSKAKAAAGEQVVLSADAKKFLAEYRVKKVLKAMTPAERQLLRAYGASPNLRALNRVIQKGLISAEEVIAAVAEALKAKRMNPRMADAIGDALRDVLGVGETIDIAAGVASGAGDPPGYKEAWRVIMPPKGRPKKADVVDLAMKLPEEKLQGATSAFHRQGPALWRWWSMGMNKRKKAGLPMGGTVFAKGGK